MSHFILPRPSLFGVLALCMALQACSSLTARKTADWAEQGQQYVLVMREVNSLAQDESLNFTADVLPNLPRTLDTLKTQTDEMRKRIRLAQAMDECHAQLGLYFKSLAQLAQGQQVAQAERTARELAASLKGMPTELKAQLAVPEVNAGFAGKLAEAVAKGQRNATLDRLLTEHAATIGEVLALNEQVLVEQSRWITLRARLAREVTYRDQVEKPFLADKPLGEAWKKAWIRELKAPSTIALLDDARQASVAMQDTWVQVVSGVQQPSTLTALNERLRTRVQEFKTRIGTADREAARP
ncbi:MAG: hypothetical protein ACK4FF_03090 [Limnobacter sp.]|uniref:hypothetical protein n=1 Tax=Limnobacter sp. TaxID=2003368 RepID=UPI003919D147